MNELTIQELSNSDLIRSRIFTIRGVQGMLAPDLADLYQVETRVFNQSVKRNIKRFPDNFRFQLTKDELNEVITNCDNPDRLRFSPQSPFAFTEQGIAMLSGVLNSDVAVQVSIRIMNTFVAMRKTLASIAPLLPLIAQKRKDVEVLVIKNSRSKLLHDVDVAQFNAQYANSLTVKVSDHFHDRFLVIDKTTLIHVGASLNHLGKKCFAFSSLDKSNIPDILAKI